MKKVIPLTLVLMLCYSIQGQQEKVDIQAFKNEVLSLVNKERKKRNLTPLKYNTLLEKAAQTHSDDMNAKDYYDHKSLDGRTPYARIKATGYLDGYGNQFIAENIALGQDTPQEVMDSWMKSRGHRKNILNPKLRDIGIGITRNNNDQTYRGYYWVQKFGKVSQ